MVIFNYKISYNNLLGHSLYTYKFTYYNLEKRGFIMKKAIIVSFVLCGCLFLFDPLSKYIFAEPQEDITTSQNIQITQEEAKELLLKYNNKVDYVYQGDSEKFEALKSKKLQGYVFLPNVEGDIGYFVDKNTSEIYFFHPSGYLESVNN